MGINYGSNKSIQRIKAADFNVMPQGRKDHVMEKENYFECCICMDNTDDPNESIHPISELAPEYVGQYHIREEWMCKTCKADRVQEKQQDKYNENFA